MSAGISSRLTTRMTTRAAAAMLLGGAALNVAQAATDAERIASERATAIASFEREQQVCETKFVVTPCLNAARARQTATLNRLKSEELQLGEAERRRLGAERQQAIRDRVDAQSHRASEAEAASAPDGARRLTKPNPTLDRSEREGLHFGPEASAGKGRQRTDEQAAQSRYEARERAAQAHREAVEQRNARLAAQGKLAAPLPVPAPTGAAASAAPAR